MRKFVAATNKRLQQVAQQVVIAYATRLKLNLRDDTRAGGLGDGVANAWQQKDYLSEKNLPASLVYSKAPLIVSAFSDDTTIKPHDGHYWLWIPTGNVPHAGNKRMKPDEVEAKFGQKLQVVKRPGGVAWAFMDLIPGKNGKGFRPKSKRRLAQGRKAKHVLMFVMLQQIHLKKRLNSKTLMATATEGFQKYVGAEIAKAIGEDY